MTAMEFDLLRVSVQNPNRVLSRDRLLIPVCGEEMEAVDRCTETPIARLRQKVEFDPGVPQAIKTVRGAGYMFVPPGHDRPEASTKAGSAPIRTP